MTKIILSETQMKRLLHRVVHEQDIPADDATPQTANPLGTVPGAESITTSAPISYAAPAPTGGGGAPAGGDSGGELSAGSGGGSGSGGDPWSTDSAAANAKMNPPWESGIVRSKGNPVGNTVWSPSITRGAGNQIGLTKWSDTVGSTLTRSKANPLKERIKHNLYNLL